MNDHVYDRLSMVAGTRVPHQYEDRFGQWWSASEMAEERVQVYRRNGYSVQTRNDSAGQDILTKNFSKWNSVSKKELLSCRLRRSAE